MKKLSVLLVVMVLLSGLFFGCRRDGDDQLRVVFIARTLGDTFPAWLQDALEVEAAALGIQLVTQNGMGDDMLIADLVDAAIVGGFDVILLQPQNTEAQRPPAERAVSAGVPLVTVNLRIPGMENVTHSVDADPFEQGAVVARFAVDQVPQNGRVVILNGPAAHPHSEERRRAWGEIFLAQRPDVTVLGEDFANWNKDEAMALMETWVVAHGQIDAVLSMNDNMAAGAIEAVRGNPLFSNLLVYGVDGTAEAALLIRDGYMTATSFQNAFLLAEYSMSIINAILTGRQVGFTNIDIDCPLITVDNVQGLIEAHVRAGAL